MRKAFILSRLRMIAAVVILGLSGCTQPTPYRPIADGTGYGDQQLEQNRYRVWFSGNSKTPRSTVENYLLFRAAEITLGTGNDWFQIVEQDTEVQTGYRTTVSGTLGSGLGAYPYAYRSYGATSYTSTSFTRPVTRYEAFAIILLNAGERPRGDQHVYDARSVISALNSIVVRPAPG